MVLGSHRDHKGVTQCCSTGSGIFFLNKDNNSCTGHCFMDGFSSEPPPVFVHPSSLDLQSVALTAAQGHHCSHPLTKGPSYPSSIIWPCVYRFLSASPALIIHTAESHSPERWPNNRSSPTLWSYLSHSITRYQSLIHKYSVHPEDTCRTYSRPWRCESVSSSACSRRQRWHFIICIYLPLKWCRS